MDCENWVEGFYNWVFDGVTFVMSCHVVAEGDVKMHIMVQDSGTADVPEYS